MNIFSQTNYQGSVECHINGRHISIRNGVFRVDGVVYGPQDGSAPPPQEPEVTKISLDGATREIPEVTGNITFIGPGTVVVNGHVSGNIHADGNVTATNVSGNVKAGGDVRAANISGTVKAGGDIIGVKR